jgi:glycosyltransferase involved in cell wall biosynthesis
MERAEIRKRFGIGDHEILCIYTGRFTEDKNPLLLAKAVATLRSAGDPYRGLFVGNGTQAGAIRQCDGCQINPFVPVTELPQFFRSADIGAWPTQESMSMLDAAACGLPIVVNDTLRAVERIEGNGLTYRLNDSDDLARVLLSLRSQEAREGLGRRGAVKMRDEFGWGRIAEQRMRDYQAALGRSKA